MEKGEKKLREMILYTAGEIREPRDWSLTRFLRVLFHSDFRAYRLLGSSISGSVYRKTDPGPAPEGVLSIISTMEREGLCAWTVEESCSCRRLLALQAPDLTVLSAEESDLLGWWVAQCLESDIAAQARTQADLLTELQRLLAGYLFLSAELGRGFFASMPKAPKRYWRLYELAKPAGAATQDFRVESQEAFRPRATGSGGLTRSS